MESLTENPILEFKPNLLNNIRKLYNLDDLKRMNESIDLLVDWVQKQDHFVKKDYDRKYLERVIISSKGSIERAKNKLDKLCTLKTLLPQYFNKFNYREDFKEVLEKIDVVLMPKLTDDLYRIILLRPRPDIQYTSKHIADYCQSAGCFGEYQLRHDYCTGYICVFDFRPINLVDLITRFNPMDIRQCLLVLTEGYGLRLKGLHLITESKVIDTFAGLLRQGMSAKLGKRIYVQRSTESLHKVVDKSLLPAELDGDEGPIAEISRKWIDELSSEKFRDYLRESFEAKTDENLRREDKFAENYIGMPGSFRSLKVD